MDDGSDLLRCLQLGQLAYTLLPRPHTYVDDLEEKLTRSRVKDEDGAVNGLGGEVALEGLVDYNSVDAAVIDYSFQDWARPYA
jgi:hypothetical protein